MQTYNWLNRTEYPFKSHYFALDNAQMHYLDEGKGEPIVFIHGTPTWSFLYRKLIKNLSQTHRCIAPDHLGFGLSDKPQDYPYLAQQHALNFEKLLNSLNINEFTLVIHDFGGVIGLHYALKYPEKIKKIIIFNTFAWSVEDKPAFEFHKFKKILKNPLLPFLYKYFNFSAKFILAQGFGKRENLTKAIHQQYIKPFGKPAERAGTLGFVKSILNEQQWFAQLWEQRAKITQKPILLLWGMKDKFLDKRYLQMFKENFPQHQVQELAEVGHFVPEEAGEALLPIIQAFMTEKTVEMI
jgi:haloalkane dehalogenase